MSFYIKNDKFIVLIEDVTSVVMDKIPHQDKIWDIVQINYKNSPSIQMPYDSEEKAKEGFRQIAQYLCKS